MAKQLLLVDGDPRTLHVLESSLRAAGFAVMTAGSGQAALARCRVSPPDLVVSDTAIPGMDGFQLCQALKSDELLKDTPLVFLSGHGSVEEKVRGLELGAEDYLTKPIDTREFVTRMRVLVEKREKERRREREQQASFAGALADLSIADLLQTLEVGRKSGTVQIDAGDGRTATLWVRDGAVIDAAAGHRRGQEAFYRCLRWREGRFAIQFGPVDRPVRIEIPTQHLLMEGLRRLDERSHALEQLPPAESVLQVDFLLLSERIADLPDSVNAVLRLVDGRRTIARVLDDLDEDEDVGAVSALQALLRDEIVRVHPARDVPPPIPARPPPVAEVSPESSLVPVGRASTGGRPVSPLASALAEYAREVARSDDRPVPRIVRFGLEPKVAVVVPPVAIARRTASPVPPAPPRVGGTVLPTTEPSPGAEERPRRPGGKLAFVVLVVLLALGFGAWKLGRPAQAPLRPRPAGDVGSDAYEGAFAAAQRDQASARFAEAAAAYRRAIAVRGTSEAYEGLGRALRDTGDTVGAVQALLRAIQLDPRNADAYIAVARIYVEARQPADARTAYEQYLAIEPGGAFADEARAAIGLAR